MRKAQFWYSISLGLFSLLASCRSTESRLSEASDSTKFKLLQTSNKSAVYSLAYSSDGNFLVTGSKDNTARVWNTSTGVMLHDLTTTGAVVGVASAPYNTFAVASMKGEITKFEMSMLPSRTTLDGSNNAASVAFSKDGKLLAATLGQQIKVWSLMHDNAPFVEKILDSSKAGVFTADGEFAFGDARGRIKFLNMFMKITDREFQIENGWQIQSVAVSSDGVYLAACDYRANVQIWNLKTRETIVKRAGDMGIAYSLSFSPDNNYLAVGYMDHTARILKIAENEEVLRLSHDADVTSVMFSPNGKYLATGTAKGETGETRIWTLNL